METPLYRFTFAVAFVAAPVIAQFAPHHKNYGWVKSAAIHAPYVRENGEDPHVPENPANMFAIASYLNAGSSVVSSNTVATQVYFVSADSLKGRTAEVRDIEA